MSSVTIKNLPEELHQRLRDRAARNARSLNAEIIECLREATGSRVVDVDALLAEARRLRQQVRGRLTESQLRAARATGRP